MAAFRTEDLLDAGCNIRPQPVGKSEQQGRPGIVHDAGTLLRGDPAGGKPPE